MAEAMNKDDFIKLMITQFEDRITAKVADTMLNGVFSTIIEALKQGKKVKVYKFGSFSPMIRPAREGRNPQTGEVINIAAKGVIKFLPSPVLKEGIESALMTKTTAKAATSKTAAKAKSAGTQKKANGSAKKGSGKATAKSK